MQAQSMGISIGEKNAQRTYQRRRRTDLDRPAVGDGIEGYRYRSDVIGEVPRLGGWSRLRQRKRGRAIGWQG